MIGVAVLGSTGSIGESTLDVLRRHPERFRVVGLSAQRNVELLLKQCVEFRPEFVAIAEESLASDLQQRLRAAGLPTRVLPGQAGIEHLAALPEAQYVMAAIVGAAGPGPRWPPPGAASDC
jgi:1-deoxy-D-xylulose-5-phosphate reductoisomerase